LQKNQFIMRSRRIVFATGMVLSLAACADDTRLSQISDSVPIRFSWTSPNQLQRAVAVGETTGGDSLLNTAGMHNDMFATLMTNTLKRNALLATPGAAHWRINSVLDIDQPATIFGDQTFTAKIRYVLLDQQGAAVFDHLVQTSSAATRPMGQVGTFLFETGNELQRERRTTIDTVVRLNLDEFLTALAEWDSAHR
jgi:hypothetical protein